MHFIQVCDIFKINFKCELVENIESWEISKTRKKLVPAQKNSFRMNGAVDDNVQDLHTRLFFESGILINQYGGLYMKGCAIGSTRIAQVIKIYAEMLACSENVKVPVAALAREAQVSWHVAKRATEAYHGVGSDQGGLPAGCRANRGGGTGSRVNLTYEQECFILFMRFEDPFMTNEDYISKFYERYGVVLSRSFVTRWLRDQFAKRGHKISANLVPIDKLRFANVIKYDEYFAYVQYVPARRLVFIDEKMLKGAKVVNRKGRGCPVTGQPPVRLVSPDFRNTYCLMGMCSVNVEKQKSVLYTIGKCI